MNLLAFFAQLVDSLAWPVLVAWLAYGFRTPIARLLGRIKSLKYKELEAEFEQTLDEIEIIPAPERPVAIEEDIARDTITIIELADVSPRAAVMEAWIRIERATRTYLDSDGLKRRYSYQGLRRLPSDKLKPIESILSPYQELRLLRNKATYADDFDINPNVAKEYVEIAANIERVIREAVK